MSRSRRFAWLGVLVVLVACFLALLAVVRAQPTPVLVPALVLVGSLVVPATLTALLYASEVVVDLSGGALIGLAFAGGVLSLACAALVEATVAHPARSATVTALVEESTKLLLPLALVLLVRTRWRAPVDGLVLGVAVGACFAALETMGYAFEARRGPDGLDPVLEVLVQRGLVSPAAHLAWTGLVTAAIWWARELPSPRRVAAAGATFVGVVALHAGWDSVTSRWASLPIAVASVAALFLVALRLGRHQVHDLDVDVADPGSVDAAVDRARPR